MGKWYNAAMARLVELQSAEGPVGGIQVFSAAPRQIPLANMKVTTKISIDLTRPNIGTRVDAMQGDGNTRYVEASLLSGGRPWVPPAGVEVAVVYRKPDGTKGLYNKLADGTPAISSDGNVVTIILAPQMLTVPGTVQASVVFNNAQLDQLTSFSFTVSVTENQYAGATVSEDYIRLEWLEDKLDEYLQKAADSGAFDGAPGHTPEYGVDYCTPEQIAGIANQAAEILQPDVSQIKSDLGYINNVCFLEDNDGWSLIKGYIGEDGQFILTPNSNTDYGRLVAITMYGGSIITVNDEHTVVILATYTDDDVLIKRVKQEGIGTLDIQTKSNVKFSIYDKNNATYTDANDALSHISIHFKTIPITESIKANTESIKANTDKIEILRNNVSIKSVFDKSKSINFGIPKYEYYRGMSNTYDNTKFNKSTNYDTFISELNALVTPYSDYVSKTNLGSCPTGWDSTYDIYEYDFVPKGVDYNGKSKDMPKILIIAGQHGMEKASPFGLYYFFKDLLENSGNNAFLSYLRNNVIIKAIPVCNPSGFTSKSYYNANGVNLNRNYDTKGFTVGTQGTTSYGGQAPFDQKETQYVRDFVNANKDALVFIDFHTNGSGAVSTYSNVNWFDVPLKDDRYYSRILDCISTHIVENTFEFVNAYNLTLPDDDRLCGLITYGDSGFSEYAPTADVWCREQNIVSLTCEGFCGFPNGQTYTSDVLKANSEIIGNLIRCILYMYNNYIY